MAGKAKSYFAKLIFETIAEEELDHLKRVRDIYERSATSEKQVSPPQILEKSNLENIFQQAKKNIDQNLITNVDEMEAVGILSSHGISEDDLRSGRFDFAEIEIFIINRQAIGDGRIVLSSGWLGEVSAKDNAFVVEVRGQTQALQQTFGEFIRRSAGRIWVMPAAGLILRRLL